MSLGVLDSMNRSNAFLPPQNEATSTIWVSDGSGYASEQLAETQDMRDGAVFAPEELSTPKAPCADAPELFFPEDEEDVTDPAIEAARRICGMCFMQDECLEQAMVRYEKFGIWGGLTSPERHSLRRRIQRTARG